MRAGRQRWVDPAFKIFAEVAPPFFAGTMGLVGASGSGKSTLAKVRLGMRRPTSGRVVLCVERIFGIGRRRPGTFAAALQHPEWSFNAKPTIGGSIAQPVSITGI